MEVHVSLVGRRDLSGEIYRQLRRAIIDGRLRPGDRLPPSRELARGLTVSRATVTVAYERLAGEGFVTSRLGAGTFVMEGIARIGREAAAERSSGGLRPRPIWDSVPLPTAFDRPARFDFRTGLPDASLFPYRAWRRLVARALRLAENAAGVYGDPRGIGDLRAAIARHVGLTRRARPGRRRRRHQWHPAGAGPRGPRSAGAGRPGRRRRPRLEPCAGCCSTRWERAWSACRSTRRADGRCPAGRRPASSM